MNRILDRMVKGSHGPRIIHRGPNAHVQRLKTTTFAPAIRLVRRRACRNRSWPGGEPRIVPLGPSHDRPVPSVVAPRNYPVIQIIEERAGDAVAIEHLLNSAFGPQRKRKISYRYRLRLAPVTGLSFVAEENGVIAGTIRHWPIVIATPCDAHYPALLLGPIAVSSSHRGHGLGGVLINTGLERARATGHDLVILVGDLPYYARFGLVRDGAVRTAHSGVGAQSVTTVFSVRRSRRYLACVVHDGLWRASFTTLSRSDRRRWPRSGRSGRSPTGRGCARTASPRRAPRRHAR